MSRPAKKARPSYATRAVRLPAAKRIVHVLGPVLAKNLKRPHDYESHDPVVAVRSLADPRVALVGRHVEILGPCKISYTPADPVPGTQGRAIAVMETEAELIVHMDRRGSKWR